MSSTMRPRHIPDVARPGYTYCGRPVEASGAKSGVQRRALALISLQSDCIEDAECKACQRSDNRRTREEYRRTEEYKRGVS